jgi:uncharacterized protein (TIRG00374 family)
MKGGARLALFGAGLALFLWLLHHVGLAQVLAQLQDAGWTLVPAAAVYVAVYACNAGAWLLLLPAGPRRPGLLASYAITTSAFAINYITPIVSAGGEPYRVAATAPWLGLRQATATTVEYYLLHALSSLLLWVAALVAALWLLPWTAGYLSGIGALLVIALAILSLIFGAQRQGVLERLLNLLHRLPLLGRMAPRFERHRPALVALDHQITRSWHERRGQFMGAVALECVGRALSVLEFWIICRGAGVPISYGEALFVGGLASFALNAFFFMPFEVGAKEGSLVLLFAALGFPATLALYAGVVSRLRELVWIVIGLLTVWYTGTPAAGERRTVSP